MTPISTGRIMAGVGYGGARIPAGSAAGHAIGAPARCGRSSRRQGEGTSMGGNEENVYAEATGGWGSGGEGEAEAAGRAGEVAAAVGQHLGGGRPRRTGSEQESKGAR